MPGFQPRIAIVGGGPSGLTLGRLLYQRGIHATIYEMRGKFMQEEVAKPSGMLTLREDSGLRVVRECRLWNGFVAAVPDCAEACRVLNPQGAVLYTDEDQRMARPEILRNAFTNLLLQNLPPDIIKWNHKITSVRSSRNAITGATEITLDVGENGTATYDFVVGADGAWSYIRRLLSDVEPLYGGAHFMTVTVRHVSTKHQHLIQLNGSGMFTALGGGNGIVAHGGAQDSIRMYVIVSTPLEHWVAATGLEGKTAAEVKTTLLGDDKLFRKWAPGFQDLLAAACDEETKDNPGCAADIKPMYMLPVGYRWEHRTGVTLVGDAAHLMTPFSGEAVNLALSDSLDLAHVLATVPEAADAAAWQAALEPRLREFEEAMLEYAQVKAEATVRNTDMFLSENGAQAMADTFKMYEGVGAIGGPHQGSRMGTGS